MATEGTSMLPRIVQNPWTVVPQRKFNAIIIGLIGASQLVLLLRFLSPNLNIGFTLAGGGTLLLWLAQNTAYDEEPLGNHFAEDGGSHGWFHIVVWSVISIAVVIETVSVILTA